MQTAEQLIAIQKSSIGAAFKLAAATFEGVEKTVELNVQAVKAALRESAEHAQAVLSVKDAKELLALQSGQLQPTAEKAASYSRHVYDIAAATSAEVTKIVEAQVAELQKNVLAAVDTALKSAPAGSESAVALVKSSVAAASNAFDSVQKAAKQATETAEANFKRATAGVVNATQQQAA
ncbi:TIGR01841 family phasin [Azohydromonas australica]|uniref:TIGR01841 family phasin n=1 Tax=Azohydromonas australica TaxID=364039 RepID=UPI00048C404F|nr:TIGR01841 family phasin [Azohydromonas australica]